MSAIKTQVQVIFVSTQENGRKIQSLVESRLGPLPKGLFMRLIRSGQIRIDGRRCKPFDRVHAGQKVRIPPLIVEDRPKAEPVLEPLDIFYQDQDMILINKAAFLPVHRGTGWTDSVHDRLQALYPDFTPVPVHRLDKDTSGLVLCAATHDFLRTMHNLWPQVTRAYLCWVEGVWAWSGWRTLESSLMKTQVRHKEQVVCGQGRQAITHAHVLETRPNATLILALLGTGRTHQIRAHLAHHLAPILGDAKYGQSGPGRDLKLHATLLSWDKFWFFSRPPWPEPWAIHEHWETIIKKLLTSAPATKGKEGLDE